MCRDILWVILHEPYDATCMHLPSQVLEPGLSLGLQGMTVGASSTPLPMDLTNDALVSIDVSFAREEMRKIEDDTPTLPSIQTPNLRVKVKLLFLIWSLFT